MRKNVLIIVGILAALGAGVALLPNLQQKYRYRENNFLPQETVNVLNNGERFVLLSLDPARLKSPDGHVPQPKDTFHGYEVLGRTEIQEKNERDELLLALYKGITDSDGTVAKCFNPRHGISATLGDKTVDLVICFECLSIETYPARNKRVLTTRSPEPTFNRALERAGLPIAED